MQDLVQKGKSVNFVKGCLDIENTYEKLTPFMLAVLREDFDTAELLKTYGLCNPEYKNAEDKNVGKMC